MEYKKYSPRSVDNYCSCLGKFLSVHSGEYTEPVKIPSSAIVNYLSKFKEPNTHKSVLSSLKMFYEKVLGQHHKFDKIEYPRGSKKLPIPLSQDEVQRMFDACQNTKHKVILALLYSAGFRVSELINLKWQHIDRGRKIINVINGKGNKDRIVGLSDELVPLLEKYYHEYKSREYVLNGQFDLQYSAKSVGEVVKQLAAKAGISKRVYTHLMRHNCFTHMVENGIDINLIQKIAGHASVKTTMQYCHISSGIVSKIPSPLSNIKM